MSRRCGSENAGGRPAPIAVFDSGVGGLSVLRALWRQLPGQDILYLADQGHVPYGPRSLEQVRAFSFAVTDFLIAQGARLVVVACNTASAAALTELRAAYPQITFVGMEPAVKPAAQRTRSGVVGVLATPATFQGLLYASVVERFAAHVTVLPDTCPGLVTQIEAGDLDGPATRRILENSLQPMLAQGVDTIVLGCTHYPFVIPLIRSISGPGVEVIDPAPAVARQTARLLSAQGQPPPSGRGQTTLYTSGSLQALQDLLPRLLGEVAPQISAVRAVVWQDLDLVCPEPEPR